MTDQDRGVYTPHADAPLAFDARRPAERRPLPMTLIASGVVLLAIVAALVLAYRGGVRGSESPKPVGEPVGAIKTAAAPEAAVDAGPKLDVYAAQNVPAAAPNFAPPPEEPRARPAAPAVAEAAPPPSGLQVRTVDTRMRIEAPAPVARAAAETPPAVTAPASRPVQTAAASAPPATKPVVVARTTVTVTAPAPVRAATTVTPEAPAQTASASGAAVQIGAFSSRALADKGFSDAAALVSAGGRGRSVESVQRDGKTFYRATLTGFADRTAAKAFCDRLAAKGGRCMVRG